MSTPSLRIQRLNPAPANPKGTFVLYWMTMARRLRFNFGLERAIELARTYQRPLVILEALRCDYPFASARIHRFMLKGMIEHAQTLFALPVKYYPYLEPSSGAGKGLVAMLSHFAVAVVTDDFPAFMFPHLLAKAAQQVEVRLEAVDSNGLLPMRATDTCFPTAYAFRAFLQRELPSHLTAFPEANPLHSLCTLNSNVGTPSATIPREVLERWPETNLLAISPDALISPLPFTQNVTPVKSQGGYSAARGRLQRFVLERLSRYGQERNAPDQSVTSELSAYLHFGHMSAHEVFLAVVQAEEWNVSKLSGPKRGRKEGFWGMSAGAEAYLDQLITWRELGFNFCRLEPAYDQYASLPPWARATLEKHASDFRPHLYSSTTLEAAETRDSLWNAAQRQLVRDGTIHNYLRMLWGKKVLEWSRTPEEALETLIYMNNKYALDGRDPNSYSGIFWIFGRYDRPWGPERPIFGTIRYMSSENTARKYPVQPYLARFGRW